MYASQRRKEILKLVKESGFKTVSELSKIFCVSEVTIRSDLRSLEKDGKIERNYGGATYKDEEELVPFSLTQHLLNETKSIIANSAVSLIKEGDSLFLDGSSTTLHLAMRIRNIKNITVITNSIPIFDQFKEYRDGILISIPGKLNPITQSFVGTFAINMLKDLRVNKAFISPKGILHEGLRDMSLEEADIRRKMMQNASEVIILADHSKFDNDHTLFNIDNFDSISTIITDKMPDTSFMKIFEEREIKVIFPDK